MKKLTVLMILTIPFFMINAQITISSTDFSSQYQVGNQLYHYFDTTVTSIDIGQPGGGNFWDFSNLSQQESQILQVVTPASTPHFAQFAGATISTYYIGNFMGLDMEQWDYVDIGSQYKFYGFVSESGFSGMSITSTRKESPPEVSMQFPINYGDLLNHTGSATTVAAISGTPISTSTESYNTKKNVDAYGTMKMPDGRTVDALRIQSDISGMNTTLLGSEYFRAISYLFISKTGEAVVINAADTTQPNSGVIPVIRIVNWTLPTVTGVDHQISPPSTFKLNQNYPNPFNPATRISFEIGDRSFVSISVFDILGSEIDRIEYGEIESGNYEFVYEAEGLPSGIYIYVLCAGEHKFSRKMTLLK